MGHFNIDDSVKEVSLSPQTPDEFVKLYTYLADQGCFVDDYYHQVRSGRNFDLDRPVDSARKMGCREELQSRLTRSPFFIIMWRLAVSQIVALVVSRLRKGVSAASRHSLV